MKKLVVILLLTTLVQTAFSQKNLSFDRSENKLVRFYPNPAISLINFEFRNPIEKGSVLQVYSFLGRKVGVHNLSGNRLTVNLTDYVTGIYIFQLLDSKGRIVESNKFQVSK